MFSIQTIKRLCAPSFLYLGLSTVVFVLAIFRHHASGALFRQSVMIALAINVVCALFYTWVLNLICRAGYSWLSWALVLAPFIMLGLSMVTRGSLGVSVE